MNDFPQGIRVLDSHTEGEPTRVVLEGWPVPPGNTMRERASAMTAAQDHLRRAVVCEPRGHDAMVGALLTPPEQADSHAGVIFFNNVGPLGMCGHGTIGVVATLRHLGRIQHGRVRLDTPAGTVAASLGDDGAVTIVNVPASCLALDVDVAVPGFGTVRGDICYGGNWFFIVPVVETPALEDEPRLTAFCRDIMAALRREGITGRDGAPIDHVELSGPPARPGSDSRNFVLCPGGAYDRSPCGTGTSAKLASLHERGKLGVGQRWRQESITGSLFTAWLDEVDGALAPHLQGRAWITGETWLRFDADDPFRSGFTPAR